MLDSEPTWIEQALKGDSQAFTQLVETYQRPVYNLCYRMLGNAQEAEDAAQETFLRAYKNLRRFDRERSFATWLLSIAAHYCIDEIRRRKMQVLSIEDLPVPDLPDGSIPIEARLGNRQEREKIRALLEVLDETDRAAVVMYYWYDFSYLEISRTLNLTESAVKSRLHRARRSMAESWLKQEAEPIWQTERILA